MTLKNFMQHLIIASTFYGALPLAWSEDQVTDPWEIISYDSRFIYSAHGEAVYGHKFGFVKTAGHCQSDILYINWSTPEGAVKEFEGVDATINFNVDGERFQLKVPLLSTFEYLPNVLTLVTFSNYQAGGRMIDLLKHGRSIEVAINSPVELRQLMDVRSDSFSLEGFADARGEALRSCISDEASG